MFDSAGTVVEVLSSAPIVTIPAADEDRLEIRAWHMYGIAAPRSQMARPQAECPRHAQLRLEHSVHRMVSAGLYVAGPLGGGLMPTL